MTKRRRTRTKRGFDDNKEEDNEQNKDQDEDLDEDQDEEEDEDKERDEEEDKEEDEQQEQETHTWKAGPVLQYGADSVKIGMKLLFTLKNKHRTTNSKFEFSKLLFWTPKKHVFGF